MVKEFFEAAMIGIALILMLNLYIEWNGWNEDSEEA